MHAEATISTGPGRVCDVILSQPLISNTMSCLHPEATATTAVQLVRSSFVSCLHPDERPPPLFYRVCDIYNLRLQSDSLDSNPGEDKKCVSVLKESRNPRKLLSAPLQWGPEAEPELGGREVARLAVGAIGAREPVDMLKALASCVVDIRQARLGYDSGDVARGAQGDVLVVDSVWSSVKVHQFRWGAAPPEHLRSQIDSSYRSFTKSRRLECVKKEAKLSHLSGIAGVAPPEYQA